MDTLNPPHSSSPTGRLKMITRQQLDRSQLRTAALAEAKRYSLNNPHLSDREKAVVEMVWQLPFGVLHYSVAFFSLSGHTSFLAAYLWSTPISLIAWVIVRLMPKPPTHGATVLYDGQDWYRHLNWLLLSYLGPALGGWGETVICSCLAIFAFAVLHRWDVALYLALAGFGVTALLEAPAWLWGIGDQRMSNGFRMSPKYAIAKRLFGTAFPFELDV